MAKIIASAIQVAYTGTHGRTAALTAGYNYLVTATTDCFILQGGSSVTVTAATGVFLPKGMGVVLRVDSVAQEGYISAIQSSSGGTLTAMKILGE